MSAHRDRQERSGKAERKKTDVAYTVHGTDREHCGNCHHYLGAHVCEEVVGYIAYGGWCELWKKGKG